jgi:DNA-binding transcriptional regulator PaaX
MSGVSHEVVFEVSSSLLTEFDGKARTAEIVNTDRVQAKETQVRKALDSLEQKGLIRFEREGREAYWVVEDWVSLFTYSASDELEKEFNSYQDKMRWCRDNL